jgi:hypothetical protein
MNIDTYIANAQLLTALTIIAFALLVMALRRRPSKSSKGKATV